MLGRGRDDLGRLFVRQPNAPVAAGVRFDPGQTLAYTPGKGYYARDSLKAAAERFPAATPTGETSTEKAQRPGARKHDSQPKRAKTKEGSPHPHKTEVPKPTPKQRTLARKLEHASAMGYVIANPLLTIQAAQRAKLPLDLALAILSQESFGGKNIWGTDTYHSIFTNGYDSRTGKQWGKAVKLGGYPYHVVTQAGYSAFRSERNSTGHSQGVGPAMLTSPGLQKEADNLGGAWKPYPNMVVGFTSLEQSVRVSYGGDVYKALVAYNAGASARGQWLIKGEKYAGEVLQKAKAWAEALGIPYSGGGSP